MHKVLIFSTAYFPYVGGAEVAVKEITDRIDDFQFDMVTAKMSWKFKRREKIGNVNVFRMGFGIPKLDKYLLAFRGHKFAQKLQKKNNYSAIWAIMASYGGFAASAFKQKNPSVPFLLTLQEGDDPQYILKRVGMFKNRFRKIFSSSDYIQCISQFLSGFARENGAKCDTEIVPNAVDVKHFSRQYSEEELSELKAKLGKLEDDTFLITTSRLVLKNAVDDIIRALTYLPENVKLLVLGTGADFQKLKDLAKKLQVERRVMFLGQVGHNELPKYLKISDIFVRPSLSEGLGNSFLEAMAAGIPVIGTPVGGILDFITDYETGLFCIAREPETIADKVRLIREQDDFRKKLIENGRQLVFKDYNWELIASKMKNIFNKLVNNL